MFLKDHKGKTIHIHLANINFKCPHCKKKYNDKDEKYYKRVDKNKSGITRVKCECKKIFYLAVDYKGEYATFK